MKIQHRKQCFWLFSSLNIIFIYCVVPNPWPNFFFFCIFNFFPWENRRRIIYFSRKYILSIEKIATGITCKQYIFCMWKNDQRRVLKENANFLYVNHCVWILCIIYQLQLQHNNVDSLEKKFVGSTGQLTVKCKDFRIIRLDIHGMDECIKVAETIESLSSLGECFLL